MKGRQGKGKETQEVYAPLFYRVATTALHIDAPSWYRKTFFLQPLNLDSGRRLTFVFIRSLRKLPITPRFEMPSYTAIAALIVASFKLIGSQTIDPSTVDSDTKGAFPNINTQTVG